MARIHITIQDIPLGPYAAIAHSLGLETSLDNNNLLRRVRMDASVHGLGSTWYADD